MPKGNHTPATPPRDAVELAVDVLSDRWTVLILREAFFGVRRYGQMQRNLGIARNVLADRLRQLVADGMFERVRYRTDPDWYEYRLTERALDLYPVIIGLMRWAETPPRRPKPDADALELRSPLLRQTRRALPRLLALPSAVDGPGHRRQASVRSQLTELRPTRGTICRPSLHERPAVARASRLRQALSQTGCDLEALLHRRP